MEMYISLSCFMLLMLRVWAHSEPKPHIILIVADDLGWNDISYHGSDQIATPNIDALAYDGVPLRRHYAQPSCTPARAALLTGNYPIRTGMQGYPLTNGEDRGLPFHTKLLPSYLKDLGYSTHAIGKWHLGMSRPGMMPTKRGFDSHFGYHGGFVDYYEYTSEEIWNGTAVSGLDLHRNDKPAWDVEGYLPDLLTDEAVRLIDTHNVTQPLFLYMAQVLPHSGNPGAMLQPPPAAVRAHRHISNQQRRLYAGLVSKLDESIGHLVKALSRKDMLKDSIIVFLSDNGARTIGSYQNWGSNWPHRGLKMTPWEGGVKVPAFVWSPKIKLPHIWDGLMHISDWMPTLIFAANGRPPSTIDGKNQWNALIGNEESKRTEVLVDLDDYDGTAAYIMGKYKLVIGNMTDGYNKHYGNDLLENSYSPPLYEETLLSSVTVNALENIGRNMDLKHVLITRQMLTTNCQVEADMEPCVPDKGKYCLYDLSTDPCERHDLSGKKHNEASSMLVRLQYYWSYRVARFTVKRELQSHPATHNYTWTPWLCDDHMKTNGDVRIDSWDFLSSAPNTEM